MHCIYQRVLVTRCIHVLSGTYAYIYSYTILSAIQSKGGSLENPDCFANSDEFFSGTWECDELRLALVSGCYLSCFRMLFVHFQVSLDTEPPPPYKYLEVGVSSQWTRNIWVMWPHLGFKQQKPPLFRVTSFFLEMSKSPDRCMPV